MSTQHEAESHPALSALDVARLAAKLHPTLCLSDATAAFQEAFEFYQKACLWVTQRANQTADDIALNASPDLSDEILRLIGIKNLEILEKEKLHFYPDRPLTDDDVQKFLGVTSLRAVKAKLRKWFRALATHDGQSSNDGEANFLTYWKAAERKEKGGERFYVFPMSMLAGVKSLEREIKKKGGMKSIAAPGAAEKIEPTTTQPNPPDISPASVLSPYVGSQAEEEAYRQTIKAGTGRLRVAARARNPDKLASRQPKNTNKGRSQRSSKGSSRKTVRKIRNRN
jgi:hypothetical protein